MKIGYLILLAVVLVVVITFFTGPKIQRPTYTADLPDVPADPQELKQWVAAKEARQPLREDNGARIAWHADSAGVTEYSLVYLHGFGGSYRDGYPVNKQIGEFLGANVYYARWGAHGLVPPNSMVGFTPDSAWEDAKEALAIGKRIGRKVILMSTSTGGTLSLKLAAEFPNDVHAILNISPNVQDDMPGTWLLNSPWGEEIATLIGFGDGMREVSHDEPAARQYFDTTYISSALVDLQVLVSTTMQDSVYNRVRCPVLTLYYYKNALEEDERVEVDVYPEVHAALGTPAGRQLLKSLPTPGTHFMGCAIKSKDTESVRRAIESFLVKEVGAAGGGAQVPG